MDIWYNGKIQLQPIKSRNENAVIFFWIYLVVFTGGVCRSKMGPLGPVVSKLHDYSGENPLFSIENVYCCCDLDKGQTFLVDVCWVGLK